MKQFDTNWKESIRWRLATSYGGIALLAALLLGMIMFAILTRFYAGLERDYLEQNARAVSDILALFSDDNISQEDSAMIFQNIAFLTDTQIRLMDVDGNVIVDTGRPQDRVSVTFRQVGQEGENAVVSSGYVMSVESAVPAESISVQESYQVHSSAPIALDFYSGGGLPGMVMYTIATETDTVSFSPEKIIRSNQKYLQHIYSRDGELLGSVEFLNGPAYGREIMRNVAMGWAIAGVLAVVLAALVGWWFSRKISVPLNSLVQTTSEMASGNLSARAVAHSIGEFSQLAFHFNQMADQVESKVETLKRFVADAAHELHTPLTALRTYLDLSLNDVTSPEQVEHLEGAKQQVERFDRMMEGLLELSKIEDSTDTTQFSPVDLGAVLMNVIEPFASQAEQKELEFSVEAIEPGLMVLGNINQLGILLENLVENAIKFTPSGGKVIVSLKKKEGDICFSIIDTGIGIPQPDKAFLFSRFHRARNAARIPGSGLGLAIAKAIADKHNAVIEISSGDSGTSVEVRF